MRDEYEKMASFSYSSLIPQFEPIYQSFARNVQVTRNERNRMAANQGDFQRGN